MKIDHIEAINLFLEYTDAQRFTYAGGVCTGRVTTIDFFQPSLPYLEKSTEKNT
jgi:hypothetical protein